MSPIPSLPVTRVAAAVALALALSNLAQAADEVTLDEVIVTAERREQNLQDIPISATEIGRASCRERV